MPPAPEIPNNLPKCKMGHIRRFHFFKKQPILHFIWHTPKKGALKQTPKPPTKAQHREIKPNAK